MEVTRERFDIVVVGHVDHGKSTVVGRLLADTGSLPQGKLDQVKAHCERTARPFEYAFLLDALKDEQSQGITIDSARVFFNSKTRSYIIIDAPGHIEFLKNMVSGASRAEAALLVIDAKEGIRENSKRHGYILPFLGIRQIAVLINKMDLVENSRQVYEDIQREYRQFLARFEVEPSCFIPISGFLGHNVVDRSPVMPWYEGPTVLDALESFRSRAPAKDQPFRMPVQDVYKFTQKGDERRIVAGLVESGDLRVGDEVAFLPSGKRSRVKTIEAFNSPAVTEVSAGISTGFTLEEQVYVTRGQIAARTDQPLPGVARRFRATIFWLGRKPLVRKKSYKLRLGPARVAVEVESIEQVIDAASPDEPVAREQVERHDVARVVLRVGDPIAFDLPSSIPTLGRFVVVDDYQISGGGLIEQVLPDEVAWLREKVVVRDYKWERSAVPETHRAERYNQRATMILISGPPGTPRKEVAKALEKRLFEEGKLIYYLGIGSLKYGVDADLLDKGDHRIEHFRRLGEVAHILLDAGILLVVSAQEIHHTDLEVLKTVVESDQIETIWLGESRPVDIACDVHILSSDVEEAVGRIKTRLQDIGAIYRPR